MICTVVQDNFPLDSQSWFVTFERDLSGFRVLSPRNWGHCHIPLGCKAGNSGSVTWITFVKAQVCQTVTQRWKRMAQGMMTSFSHCQAPGLRLPQLSPPRRQNSVSHLLTLAWQCVDIQIVFASRPIVGPSDHVLTKGGGDVVFDVFTINLIIIVVSSVVLICMCT